MKTTMHYKGHRWTNRELRELMSMWAADEPLTEIAAKLSSSTAAILKMVNKLRKNGIPLARRKKGNPTGRHSELWTQGEVEYLVRRRREKATSEEIAIELGRTWCAINAMIGRLRSENVAIAMRGNGVRKLWSADGIKAVTLQDPDLSIIELQPTTTPCCVPHEALNSGDGSYKP